MKIKKISIAIVAGAAVLLSSCVADAGVWGASVSYASPGFSSSVAWTNASYDVNGFPIYGYAYGRPVYGYTAAGAAIFSIAALTAWCYVPDWGPAPWYHGPHHHPHHCHRVPAPPKYAPGHQPHKRPSGGMHAPIHKNPSSVLGKPIGHSGKPNHGNAHHNGRPNGSHGNHQANRPNNGRPNGAFNNNNHGNRPSFNARPGNNNSRPGVSSRPNNGRPDFNSRPGNNNGRPNVSSRPSGNSNPRPALGSPSNSSRPSVSRPSTPSRPSVSRPSTPSRPSVSAPSRPSVSRPSAPSRPSVGGGRPSGGGHRR